MAGVPAASIRALAVDSTVGRATPAEDAGANGMKPDARIGLEGQESRKVGFSKGDAVEYFSKWRRRWVEAKVIKRRSDGRYDLDRKAGVANDNIRALPCTRELPRISPVASTQTSPLGSHAPSPRDTLGAPTPPGAGFQQRLEALRADPAPPLGSDSGICVGSADDIGLRPTMEDAFVFHRRFGGGKDSSFLAVYDGHNGRECADIAARELHEHLLREMQAQPQNMTQAFSKAFVVTDQSIYSQGVFEAGCTACVCVLRKKGLSKIVHTAHVGDTRAVLCRNGHAMRIHSAGGAVFNGRVNGVLAIARALGDQNLKAPLQQGDFISNVPHVTSMHLEAQDEFIIMACDGLWDVMSDQDAVNLVRDYLGKNKKMGSAAADLLAHLLVKEALARGASDNVTCA